MGLFNSISAWNATRIEKTSSKYGGKRPLSGLLRTWIQLLRTYGISFFPIYTTVPAVMAPELTLIGQP
ncbi:hypothetical protein RCO48_02675 [Peribacillus frigoritolerans]|nr:hypothetical protein [Peribacillus frigoritolerans]